MANRRCAIDGCEGSDLHAHGLCLKHYRRRQRHGSPLIIKRDTSGFEKRGAWAGALCRDEGCRDAVQTKGLCKRHYELRRRRAILAGSGAPAFRAYMRAADKKHRATPHGKARAHLDNAKRRKFKSEGTADGSFLAFVLANARHCSVCLGYLGNDRTVEHSVPLSRGGRHDRGNIEVAHSLCNIAKGTRTAAEVWL